MPRLKGHDLKLFLDEKVEQYNCPRFIEHDPISIPHQFTRKQDIEIAGLLAATLAWGQRVTIINNCQRIMDAMDQSPHDFLVNHRPTDLKRFEKFVHRTFNATDLLYFIHRLSHFYRKHDTLEDAFFLNSAGDVESGLIHFHNLFFSLPGAPQRTRKHVATPERKSACKRLNMFLRWMIRDDKKGVDFGLWKKIRPAQLICPLDVHVGRVALKLKLMKRDQADWQAAVELTNALRKMDSVDPVKYDFALFGLGVEEKF